MKCHIALQFLAGTAPVHMFAHTFARPELREHSLECFARLVRLLLGPDAIAETKLEHGVSLVVLGVKIKLSKKGLKCRPAGSKTTGWLQTIDAALESGKLCAGSASKLAGAANCDHFLCAIRLSYVYAGQLSWGCSCTFRRLGRAMLRPIFDQKSKRNGLIDPELRRALQWWDQILRMKVAERLAWQQADTYEVHMFCDAAGSPAHLAAVLLMDGQTYFTHAEPSQKVMKAFYHRRDNQIMGLELLAISLGLETFKELLSGRRVVIHSDNSGSEVGSIAFLSIVLRLHVCDGRCQCGAAQQGVGITPN